MNTIIRSALVLSFVVFQADAAEDKKDLAQDAAISSLGWCLYNVGLYSIGQMTGTEDVRIKIQEECRTELNDIEKLRLTPNPAIDALLRDYDKALLELKTRLK